MNILVTGGAGYIGSHTVQHLKHHGHSVWILDDLSRGNPLWLTEAQCFKGSVHNQLLVRNLINQYRIQAVIHFAAYAYVGESVEKPLIYYHNNVEGTRCLLAAMAGAQHKPYLIFSSTCATYGVPEYLPLDEAHVTRPINPYGHSKLMAEQLIKDTHQAHGLPYVILRYFNAAGAAMDGTRGECHDPEPHLIPSILRGILHQQPITVNGNQYPTPDGTCIRDFIHVDDLASAHRQAIHYLEQGHLPDTFNLGTGQGYSVTHVINTCEKITGQTTDVINGKQRPGDPAELVADPHKANTILGWTPEYSDLETIIRSAWQWHKTHHGV